MPKVSQEHLDARRAEILEGARRAFSRYGYEGATVARLEEEIGLSRGAIFHYFDSKLDLFVELAYADNNRYVGLLTEEGIEAVLRAIATADRDWLNVLIETEVRMRHDPELERRMAGMQERAQEEQRDRLLASFEQAQAEGRMRSDLELGDVVDFTTVLINGLAVRVANGDPISIDAFVRLVNDALRPDVRELAFPS
jgi:TetR/AcrR family transcriptional regulator, transcriptional repressor of aconitase